MSSRRQTLGPVNQNRTSAFVGAGTPSAITKKSKRGRASMMPRIAPGDHEPLLQPSPVPKGKAVNRRKSVAAGNRRRSTERRQTIIPPPPSQPKPDPRPISEKAYQSSCIKRLVQFLMSSKYDQVVNAKTLTRPSGKDFENIVTFMLRRIDPTFHTGGKMKFEDETAMNFKSLAYPFPISKTALVAAGSPHTWPALLAALTWLMELLETAEAEAAEQQNQVDENKESAFKTLEEVQQETNKEFFRFLKRAYDAFLHGDNEEIELLESELTDVAEKHNMVIEQSVEHITDHSAAIVEEMQFLGEQANDLPSLEKKRDAYILDIQQFHDLIKQMEEHKHTVEQKVKERTIQNETINQELEAVTDRVNKLKETIQTQDLSVDDIRKMKNEHKRLVESRDRLLDLKQKHTKALLEADGQLSSIVVQLDRTVAECNVKMADVTLFSDLKFKMNLNPKNAHSRDQRKHLGVDVHSEVIPALNQCKAEYAEKTAHARKEHQELLDQVEASEASVTEALDGLKIVEGRIAKQEELLNREREEQEGALKVRKRELASIESQITSLMDPVALEEQIAHYQRQCVELEAMQMKHEKENIAKKKELQDKINATMRAVQEHEQYKKKKLAELQQYILKAKASVGTLAVPLAVTSEK